jgi:hypothetical protein
LLIDPDGGASKEIDMVVARKPGDQAKQESANDCDPALEIKADEHRSEEPLAPSAGGQGPWVPLAHTRSGVQKA